MALERELMNRGHLVGREIVVRVVYKAHDLGSQRVDMIVHGKLVVETKTGEQLTHPAARQLYSYLRATRVEVGLLLHFGPEPRFHRLICRDRPGKPPRQSRRGRLALFYPSDDG